MGMCRACVALCILIAGIPAFGQTEEKFNQNQRINRIRDLGKKDLRVIPTLAEYLSDPSRDIRIEAVKAIVKIGTEASLAPLVTATHDNDPKCRFAPRTAW